MSCYHPLKGFIVGTALNGKNEIYVTGYDIDHVELRKNSYVPVSSVERSPFADRVFRDFFDLPCGRCIGCRLAYSRQWADRCMCENELHDSSYFVTLTYNPEHLHMSEYIDDDGVIQDVGTLVKRDLQLFFKRLRKNTGQKLRYFACGEYGSETARPHYHAIIFGLKLDDLQIYKRNFQGDIYYTSPTLDKAWSVDLLDEDGNKVLDSDGHVVKSQIGHVIVADVTWESCAYTARYIMKKQLGRMRDVYDVLNIESEFIVMSRKPGIGKDFFEQRKQDFLDYKETNLTTAKGGRKIKNIKYFDKILERENPEWYNDYKEEKQQAIEKIKEFKLSQTDLDYHELLAIEERNIKSKSKTLLRKEI